MSYTADAPKPPTTSLCFEVTFRYPVDVDVQLMDWETREREIAEALASQFRAEVTVDYQPPF
jgi:hypothetical protein